MSGETTTDRVTSVEIHQPEPAAARSSRPPGRVRALRLLLVAAIMVVVTGALVTPAAGAHSDPKVIAALDETGRYTEIASDPELESAVDRLNARGIAFAWLDQGGDDRVALSLAEDYVEDLDEIGSRYTTVIVLSGDGFGASSYSFIQAEMDPALDAAFNGFADTDIPTGLDAFGTSLDSATTATTTGGTSDSGTSDSGSTSDRGGPGFGSILLLLAVGGGGFLLFRRWRAGRRAAEQAAIDLEEDRAEIKEQLKNNADHVIWLGDRAIASKNSELIRIYEEASETYQQVSEQVDGAETAEVVDALDDRIDHAEWQFETIEARLEGRALPPRPTDDDDASDRSAGARPPAPSRGDRTRARDRVPTPPPERDRSVITSSDRRRRAPRPEPAPRRRSGGGLGGALGGGGGLGGVLGGILGNIILGGGLGGGGSRRTRRRSGFDIGFPTGSNPGTSTRRRTTRRTTGGGLGGGVLRRGGSSRTRSSRPSGGGRSINRKPRSGGGRRL